MEIEALKQVLNSEAKYRLVQSMQAVFKDLVSDWNEATVLPKELQEKLKKNCSLEIDSQIVVAKDGTTKALINLADGKKVEVVLMRYRDERNTVCVSSQAGCPMGCLFCATGKMGTGRNLTVGEMLDQVLLFARHLKKEAGEDGEVSNIVFMGMGEPFLNYDNVMEAIKILNDPKGFALGIRYISISTCGIVDGINKFAEENLQVNLAISLHAPNDKLRSKLMPINKQNPINKVLEAVDNYIAKSSRKVMFEYLMLKGVNDSSDLARELASIMNKSLYMVNLIAYNATGDFEASPKETVDQFSEILKKMGVAVTIRHSFGREIKAACGQLAGGV